MRCLAPLVPVVSVKLLFDDNVLVGEFTHVKVVSFDNDAQRNRCLGRCSKMLLEEIGGLLMEQQRHRLHKM